MVHLCAPTTYAKQYKQLCDSKINNFKHEGYHKVKCIGKELGYRNNRGDVVMTMYPEVHTLASANLRWSGVGHKDPQTPRRPHRMLLEPSHQDGRLDPLWNLEGGHRTRTKLGAISTT